MGERGEQAPVSSPYEQKTAPNAPANLSSILIGLNGATCPSRGHSPVAEWEYLETSHMATPELGVGQLLQRDDRVGFPGAIRVLRREGRGHPGPV